MKKQFTSTIYFLLIITLLSVSCQKSSNNYISDNLYYKNLMMDANDSDNGHSLSNGVFNASMIDIFASVTVDSINKTVSDEQLDILSGRIKDYLKSNANFEDDSITNELGRDELIMIGLAKIIADTSLYSANPSLLPNGTTMHYVDCIVGAVGTVVGIGDLVVAWQSGASYTTLIATSKFLLKKAGMGLMVGYGVYQIGDCLGWW